MPSYDKDDAKELLLYGQRQAASATEVLIGTARTDADGAANAHLASFVTDILGTPSEKAYVDGAGAITATSFSQTGGTLTINNGTAQALTAAGAGPFTLTSHASNANVTSSVAAITLQSDVTLTANDLVLNVKNAAGTSLLKVDAEGDTTVHDATVA